MPMEYSRFKQPCKKLDLKKLLYECRVEIICLVETKISEKRKKTYSKLKGKFGMRLSISMLSQKVIESGFGYYGILNFWMLTS